VAEKSTILIVDDSYDDRDMYKRFIRRGIGPGAVILEAGNGEEALRLQAEKKPTCILLDYSLPGRNGLVVLQDILKADPHAAVIMLTGQGNEAVAVEVMKAGAKDYLIKDAVTADSLQRCISSAIDRARLESLVEQKRQSLEIFTRAMAHDLKEPVRAIRSFAGIVAESPDLPEQERDMMNFIIKAGENMEKLIQSVSHYTQLDAYEHRDMKMVSVAEVVVRAEASLSQQIQSSNATVETGEVASVYGDQTLLVQLLQNLIQNAIRYCDKPEPHIRVWTEATETHNLIHVRDNGPGIAPEFHARIFEPFKRLVGRDVEGSGLGLAFCKRIAEIHGGTIQCTSALGQGTTFTIALPNPDPAVLAGAPAPRRPVASLPATGSDPEILRLANVLLVEDNPVDVTLTKIKLMKREQVHFNLHVASNGREAITLLEKLLAEHEVPPMDLVLLDINMPIMDGFQVLEVLGSNERLRPIPVCMLSTSSDERDILRAKERGAQGYMIKPATISQLQQAVRNIATLKLVTRENGIHLCA
jgi:signal transduction histidine kinase